ncbi:MAG: YCF48-related protein [Ignavibacteriales bacterium]|nr:YCF48-related protein [Ignavibacteriales bacterium]
MRHTIALLTMLFLVAVPVLAQTPAVEVILTVADGAGGTQQLRFGLDPSATDGIDAGLGELELPPTPPTGVFDARFIGGDIGLSLGQGLVKDFRLGSTSTSGIRTHELQYQVGGGTSITLTWNLPSGATGRLQDVILGSLIDQPMSGSGSYTVTNPGAFSKLKMTVTYAFVATNPPTATTGSASSLTTTDAQLSGTVNPNGANTTYYFEYGTTTNYGSQTSNANAGTGTATSNVTATLTGLSSNTLYHYRLVATNTSGTSRGGDMFFTTAQVVLAPTVTTGPATNVTVSGAQLTGSVNPNGVSTTYYFEYGATTSYGSQATTTDGGSGSSASNVAFTLAGLSASTVYHYRIVATNSAGTSRGNDMLFTTSQLILAPTVTTGSPSSITASGVQVSGTVNPNGASTTYYFEYGTSATYGSQTASTTAGSGATVTNVSATLSGLSANTFYHYRIVGANSAGTSRGNDMTFTTAQASTQIAAVDVLLIVSDGAGGSQQLRFGVDPAATDGVDASFGELELPPTPPAGVFDARFVGDDIGMNLGQGMAKDYRQGTATMAGVRTHELRYQLGTGTSITITWTLPTGVTGRLQDVILGTLIDQAMSGSGSYTVTNPSGFSKLKMTATYVLNPVTAPTVTTGSATNTTASGALVSGFIDPKGATTSYYFEYGPTVNYGSQTNAANLVSGLAASNVSTALVGLNSNTLYHYRLVATNSAGTSRGNDMTFTTGIIAPQRVALALPSNGTMNLSTSPVLSWNASAGATGYRLEVSTAPDFSALAYSRVLAATSQQVSGLDFFSTYYWRVTASNSAGASAASDAWLFTTSGTTNIVPKRVWTSQTSGTTQHLQGVCAVNELAAWGCGLNATILKTTDGGSHWTSIQGPDPSMSYYALTAIDENTILLSAEVMHGSAYTANIVRTSDGGATWSKTFEQEGGWINTIDMFDSQNGIAIGDPLGGAWTIMKTGDGGRSWQSIAVPPTAITAEYGAAVNNTFWIGGQLGWFGTSKNRILSTTDGGASWSSISVPQLAVVGSIGIVPSGAMIVCGPRTVLRSSNQGQAWESLAFPGTPSLSQFARVSAGTLWLSVGNSLFSSSDAGTNWQAAGSLPTAIKALAVKVQGSKEYGWVVGESGAIMKYQVVYTGISDPKVDQVPIGFTLDQNYPNPFNPSTAISYQLSALGSVKLKVLDMLGREVATLVNETESAGHHIVQWDASGMASGVYLYQLTASEFVATKRMILLR